VVIEKVHCTLRDKESVIIRLKSNVPDCVGVPENVPPFNTAAEFVTIRPEGNPVADHVKGGTNAPPVAENVMLESSVNPGGLFV